MDRRNPVNRTYANSPLLACGSTRHEWQGAAVQTRPFAPVERPEPRGQFIPVATLNSAAWSAAQIRRFGAEESRHAVSGRGRSLSAKKREEVARMASL